MIQFITFHDTLTGPPFPYKDLDKFSFMKVETEHLDGFKDKITITVEKEREDITDEEIYTTIFSLGKLVGQLMYS